MRCRNDLDLYERNADRWWDRDGHTFRSLHAVNDFRLALLREWFAGRLEGLRVADLGCGGGLLAVPLIREDGARLVGVDIGAASVAAARSRGGPRFVRGDVLRVPLAADAFDLVLLSDVVEHVSDAARALREASRVLVPGGSLYVSTLNRTRRAKRLAVDLAEGIGLVPRGTHDAEMFVEPEHLAREGAAVGLALERLQGEAVDVWRTLRRWAITLRKSDDVSVTYSALFRKERPS